MRRKARVQRHVLGGNAPSRAYKSLARPGPQRGL